METAVWAANWVLTKVLTKLSDELVAAYMASSQLGINFRDIKRQLLYTQGLLHVSSQSQPQPQLGSSNPFLYRLLGELSNKADEADDILDELHYFIIQDHLDDTKEAAEEVDGALQGLALHGRHAVRHTIGNWLPCFSSSPSTQDDGDSALLAATTNSNQHNSTNTMCSNDGDSTVDKLPFNRVAMSNKIKSIIEEINSICLSVSDLLKIPNHNSSSAAPLTLVKRPHMGSIVTQDKKLHGRTVIFEKTVNAITGGTYQDKILSVLPFVGLGGIGKTTFTQHLYNDERIKGHFTVRVWLSVSTDFDVIKLTRQILTCIATEKDSTSTTQTDNLDHLQNSIAQKLKSKSFLIVMDDIWKCNSELDWKSLLAPFTKGDINGNLVLVTTRFPYIAHMVKTTDPLELHGLEPYDFFAFFEACIFGHSKPEHYENELIDVAQDIAMKLKGFPLVANTVGRLLKKNFSREYWIGVLEKNEWQNTTNEDDIMPSLKISYYYLPFYLKKCFSYCALFPKGHMFYSLEITSLWSAVGIIDSNCQNDKNYLEELVDNGFLIKDVHFSGYYVMHDLLHELSQNVSSQECVNISSLSFRADEIPRSIRHLSITVEDTDDEIFREEIGKLKSLIDIENLRTLMIFGSHDLEMSNILKDTFEKIKGLRVLFIEMSTQDCLPKNFSNLIHLQYLKLMSLEDFNDDLEITLPNTLSRFYHFKLLDTQDWNGSDKLPKDISRLVNLRYFLSCYPLYSNISEVGKMKCLQELKEFHVKKESFGFELRQLGELRELRGELNITNLETVASKEEASDAKLKNKRNLAELKLFWNGENQTRDGDVLESLEPPSGLRVLGIINFGGASVGPPSWLFSDIRIKRLEYLHLEGVCWKSLPPFEYLPQLTRLRLVKIGGMHVFEPGFSGVTEKSFMHLKAIEIQSMLELEKWVRGPNMALVSRLESIQCIDCPLLSSFSFLVCCANLRALDIRDCPKLSSQLSLPCLPHTRALADMCVKDGLATYLKYKGKKMHVDGYGCALDWKNMDTDVESIVITGSPQVSLSFSDLEKLNSLRKLVVSRCDNIFSAINLHDDEQKLKQRQIQLDEFGLDSIPAVLTAPFCSRLAANLHTLMFRRDVQFEIFTDEQEQALHLLTSLQRLHFEWCHNLRRLPRGLYRLSSLKELHIEWCHQIRSLPPKEDLPLASLQKLKIHYCSYGMKQEATTLKETNPCLLVQVDCCKPEDILRNTTIPLVLPPETARETRAWDQCW